MHRTLNRALRLEFHVATQAFLDAAAAGVCPMPEPTRRALDHLDRLEAARANHQTADVHAARAVYAERVAAAIRREDPVCREPRTWRR